MVHNYYTGVDYTGVGENCKAAVEDLRKNAAADDVKINFVEILYQCRLWHELPQPYGCLKEFHSEPDNKCRRAFEDVLKEAGLSEKEFRRKKKTGECQLEVIASGPYRKDEN